MICDIKEAHWPDECGNEHTPSETQKRIEDLKHQNEELVSEVELCRKNLKVFRDSLTNVGDQRDTAKEIAEAAKSTVTELRKAMGEIRFCLSAPGPGTEAPPRKIDEAWKIARNYSVEGEQFEPGDKVNYGIHGIIYTIVQNHWYGDYKLVWIKTDITSHAAERTKVTKVKPVAVAPLSIPCPHCDYVNGKLLNACTKCLGRALDVINPDKS